MDEIRAYRQDDESACLGLFDSNRPKYFAEPERDLFAAYLRRMDEPFFVAEVAGHVRGCGGFRVNDYGVGYLSWGMVQGDWHRRGVGAHLLRWRLDRIPEFAHAWCVLIDTSQHTAPFFARFGFEAFRVMADGYQPGLDKVFMRLTWGPPRAQLTQALSADEGRTRTEFEREIDRLVDRVQDALRELVTALRDGKPAAR